MEIIIYTTTGCEWCSKVRELLQRANITDYIERKVGIDYDVATFHEEWPQARAYPVVIVNGEFVGGLIELAKLFLKLGLVSSKKK